MIEQSCGICGWNRNSFSAASCVRCGAMLPRASGFEGVTFAASHGPGLAHTFANSRLLAAAKSAETAPRALAWTGFGSNAALLLAGEVTLTLERLSLSARAGAPPWSERTALAEGLPTTLLDSLIAPPIAGRIGTALITNRELLFFPYPDSRLPGSINQKNRWSPPRGGDSIRAVALSPVGDIYIAVAGDVAGVSVRDAFGQPIAEFENVPAEPGEGMGLAIQGRAGDVTIYVWSNGQISWRRVLAGVADDVATLAMPALQAPALMWRQRLDGADSTPVPWLGWREAACGVYPMLLGEKDQARFGALLTGAGAPSLVYYCRGKPILVASGSPSATWFADEVGLKAVHPRNGAQLAERPVPPMRNCASVDLSSGNFLSLVPQAAGQITVTGWNLHAGQIDKAFETQLLAPRAPSEFERAPLQLVGELAPLEIDDGVMIAVQEGAGLTSRLRLCAYDGKIAGAAAP